MTVGELRKALERVPDEVEVMIHQLYGNDPKAVETTKVEHANTQGGRRMKVFVIG